MGNRNIDEQKFGVDVAEVSTATINFLTMTVDRLQGYSDFERIFMVAMSVESIKAFLANFLRKNLPSHMVLEAEMQLENYRLGLENSEL
jgi:hypothetical protein